MKLKLISIAGVPLYIHITTILLFILLLWAPAIVLIYFSLMLFFIVLHEYGHCIMAAKCGWKVHDVTMWPIGGLASIETSDESPKNEILVSLAGPAVSLFLTLLFCPILIYGLYVHNIKVAICGLMLSAINLAILIFNMIPIYPLDGGRVLRALLAYKFGYVKGSRIALRLGLFGGAIMAVVCMWYGLLSASIIFCFTFLGCYYELTELKLRSDKNCV